MIPMISFTMLRRKSMYTPPPYSTPINMMNKISIPLIAILGYREQDGQHHADNHYIDPQIKKQRRANQPDNGNGLVEPQSSHDRIAGEHGRRHAQGRNAQPDWDERAGMP